MPFCQCLTGEHIFAIIGGTTVPSEIWASSAHPPLRRGLKVVSKEIMYYVYFLESLKNSKHYIGYTDDLKRRFKEHNEKRGSEFTSKNGPWKLIFYEAHINEQDAREMERFYKTGYGREVLKGKLKNYFINKDCQIV